MSTGTRDEITVTESAEISEMEAVQPAIRNRIYVVRGQQMRLDSDLALLHPVETKVFNQAAKRNEDRFPESFRFQLMKEEVGSLRSQIVTSNKNNGEG